MSFKLPGLWLTGMAASMVLGTTGALAQDAQALYVKGLAATCANCHGPNGRAVDGSTVPALAGLSASYIVEQMNAFKSGARPATVMQQLAKGYNDAQVKQIAAYFAAQKK
jgi:cytochrome c553